MHLIVRYYFYSINIPQGITIQSGYLIIWMFAVNYVLKKRIMQIILKNQL